MTAMTTTAADAVSPGLDGPGQVVVLVVTLVLGLAALLTTVRIVRGPSVVDRAVAADVLVSILCVALGVEAAASRHATTLPILVTLSLVGFVGSVAVARFAARARDLDTPGGPEAPTRPSADTSDTTGATDTPDPGHAGDGPADREGAGATLVEPGTEPDVADGTAHLDAPAGRVEDAPAATTPAADTTSTASDDITPDAVTSHAVTSDARPHPDERPPR